MSVFTTTLSQNRSFYLPSSSNDLRGYFRNENDYVSDLRRPQLERSQKNGTCTEPVGTTERTLVLRFALSSCLYTGSLDVMTIWLWSLTKDEGRYTLFV